MTRGELRLWSVPELADHDFAQFRELIHSEAGIYLAEHKRPLVVGRLSPRLRALGLDTFRSYLKRVKEDPAERIVMVDCLCTNETRFFREPQQFRYLQEQVFPIWEQQAQRGERTRHVRVWSAACSTGEEPFTLAMLLLERFPPSSGWSVDIVASDLSTRALAKARQAIWPIARAQEIPESYRKRYMLRGVGVSEGTMKAKEEVRAPIRFERINLIRPPYSGLGTFDVIFCRNVLIYFDPPSRAKVVRALAAQLEPGGYLFLGHAEGMGGIAGLSRCAQASVYRKSTDGQSVRR